MQCRLGCGACCIAPSISSAIPGMPQGKAAGERCIQLNDDNLCLLFNDPRRPAVCLSFSADKDICGDNNAFAMTTLNKLELITAK